LATEESDYLLEEHGRLTSEQTSRSSSPVEAPDPEAAKPVFAPYNPPAGGWAALRAVVKARREQSVILKGSEALLSMNQPEGALAPFSQNSKELAWRGSGQAQPGQSKP
jgi:hypothetical protein